ncbi:hypothetical protein Tco_1308745 [Tanacetum coccineum]
MALTTRANMVLGSSSEGSGNDQGVVSDDMKQFMSELVDNKLVGIHQILDNLVRQIANLGGSQQGGNNRGNQVGRTTRVKFPRFNGDDVRDWVFRCEQFFLLDGIPEEWYVLNYTYLLPLKTS